MTPSHEEIIAVLRPFAMSANIMGPFGEDMSLVYIALGDCRAARDLLSRLDASSQEGGDAADTGRPANRPHVAPPASGADSGRAQWWSYTINYGPDGEENYANVYADTGEFVGNLRIHLARKIVGGMNALASEYSRGEAAGRRSGIEEAAKVAEETDYYGKVPLGWTLAVSTAADNIRSLITKEAKPEIDPNAWAFKNGLEST